MLRNVSYLLGQRMAQELDIELMQVPGFSIDQLMELAGLSIACAIAAVWPVSSRVMTICGPGNNGGDGLVCARHLVHFGYKPTIVYPKEAKTQLFKNLLKQLEDLDVPIMTDVPDEITPQDYDVVVDGVFGFSFNPAGGVRAPFDKVLTKMIETKVPVASIDIPSGWDVEKGDVTGNGLKPDMLISLSAPKKCAAMFQGKHHYLGGRFLPPGIVEKYGLQTLPKYPGTDQCVRLTDWDSDNDSCKI